MLAFETRKTHKPVRQKIISVLKTETAVTGCQMSDRIFKSASSKTRRDTSGQFIVRLPESLKPPCGSIKLLMTIANHTSRFNFTL